MPEFRAYFLDEDGHIENRINIVCEDETTAEDKVKRLLAGHDVELWQGDRKIGTFSRRPALGLPPPAALHGTVREE